MSRTRIIELAHIISANTQVVDAHLSEKGLPTPSFDADLSADLLLGHGGEFEAARQAVMEATDELQTLMQAPQEYMTNIFVSRIYGLQRLASNTQCKPSRIPHTRLTLPAQHPPQHPSHPPLLPLRLPLGNPLRPARPPLRPLP